DLRTIEDYAAWYATVLPWCLTIPKEAWATGARQPIEIWHGSKWQERVVGPNPEDPFD
ncbi:hypothetical protein KI387_016108, partial [Taxus chinensis]